MIAALINAIGIVIGGTLGTLFRGRISDRFTNTLMAAMGLVIIGLGVQYAMCRREHGARRNYWRAFAYRPLS